MKKEQKIKKITDMLEKLSYIELLAIYKAICKMKAKQ